MKQSLAVLIFQSVVKTRNIKQLAFALSDIVINHQNAVIFLLKDCNELWPPRLSTH